MGRESLIGRRDERHPGRFKSPDQLYDDPANDIEVASAPHSAGAVEGSVHRLLRIGFEVRLIVLTVDGDVMSVVLTRTHARRLGLAEGATVWLTPATGATVIPSMRAVG